MSKNTESPSAGAKPRVPDHYICGNCLVELYPGDEVYAGCDDAPLTGQHAWEPIYREA